MLFESHEIVINGDLKYRLDLGDRPQGNMTRIENIVKNLEERMKKSEETIDNHKRNLENSKLEYEKPFHYEEEYKTKLARQFELNQELDLGRNDEDVVDEDENGVEDELELDVAVGV